MEAAGIPDLTAKFSENSAIGLVFMAQRHSKKVPKYLQVIKVRESRNRTIKHLGSIVMLKAMAERMNIRGFVDSIMPMDRESDGGLTHGQIVEALVINRCHAPVPLYDMAYWAGLSGLSDLYGVDPSKFNDDRIRVTLDLLHGYTNDIQSGLALRAMSEFNVPAKELLYDITSVFFKGDHANSEYVEYGYSRDNKPDKKQVNVGLTVSKEGSVPFFGTVLTGGTADTATVESNVIALKSVLKRNHFLQITDSGMLAPANVHTLEQQNISFVAPWRATTDLLDLVDDAALTLEEVPYRGAKGADLYRVAELGIKVTYEEELTDKKHVYWQRAIIVESSSKQSRDAKTRIKRLTSLDESLETMRSGLNVRRLKTRAQAEAKLDRIFSGPCAQYRPCFNLQLEGPDLDMKLTWSVNETALNRLKNREGRYVLLTNLKNPEEHTPQSILELYKTRNAVENRMRDLKSNLKIRPLFVQTDDRILSLVLITIIGLQLYSLIEWEAHQAQEQWTTRFLKKKFAQVCMLQTINADGTIEIEWCNLTSALQRTLKKLGLKLPDLPDRLFYFVDEDG